MGVFRFLFKWSLEITGTLVVGYNYGLKPEQQADLYGLYRSCFNSYRAAKQVYAAINQYKGLTSVQSNPEEFKKQLNEVNINTAKRIEELSRINRGVYMRLGQYLGSLRFAFPTQFSQILKDLNEKTNYQPQDYKYLKKHIEAQLGKKTKELFESLNTSPIKSENFYQVYKGELATNFLDVNLKVIHPYAAAQAKYDFMFLKKAIDYVNKFQQSTFSTSQKYPLYLDLLYTNLKQSVEKELNLVEQQKVIADVKQKLTDLVTQQKSKPTGGRALPVYVPHIYSQYTKQKIMIQEYFEGSHLSDSEALLKQNFNRKNISSDLLGIWNTVLEKNKLILQQYTPFELFIRKSRVNEEGSYQICPLNLGFTESAPQFLANTYPTLWKEFVSGVKVNPKKQQERINSIRTFYHNLPQIYFSLFLNNTQKINQLTQKVNLSQVSKDNTSKFVQFSKSNISKDISKKIESAKILPVTKSKQPVSLSEKELEQYENLRRAFEIEYQPWKIEQLFKTYKQIFREEKNFGLF